MCKLFIVANSKKIKNQKTAINLALDLVTHSEKSGVGYFGVTKDGIVSEKSTDHKMRYGLDQTLNPRDFTGRSYERHGMKSRFTGPLVFHGRTSTNDISLVNTHPIIKDGWFLSHNGVVSNVGEKYSMISTNDSEHVLHHYSKEGIKGVGENLTGYYAFAAIGPDLNLTVARDKIAYLYHAWIETIDSDIFATSKLHIEEFCEELKYKYSKIELVNDDTYINFSSAGEYLGHGKFESQGYGQRESIFAEKSLGRTLKTKEIKPSFVSSSLKIGTDETKHEIGKSDFVDYVLSTQDQITLYDKDTNKITLKEFELLSFEDQIKVEAWTSWGEVITDENFYRAKYSAFNY